MTARRSELGLAAALGLVQGPAEVLPVSSSAHVELLAGRLGRAGAPRKELAVALHAGSAVALLAAGARPRCLGLAALTLAVPSAVGYVVEAPVQERLGGPGATAAGLVAGSVGLVVADLIADARTGRRGAEKRRGRRTRRRWVAGRPAADLRAADALVLGVAEACALWPGVSRSGAVLAAARARGFSTEAAWALARETAVPVLVAATTLKGARAARRGAELRAPAVGAAVAAVATAAALRAAPAAQRLPVAAWAAYRCSLAAAVLRVRETWPR